MKYIYQLMIICIISCIGEFLNLLLPFPIPASIYGMVILFIALCAKIIKLEQIENVADFLLSIMPIFFIPPSVSLMTRWGILKANLVGLLVTCIVSTAIVFGVTGCIAQAMMRHRDKKSPKTDVANSDGEVASHE